MSDFIDNRFQTFFENRQYIALKNYLYNYLLRKRAILKTIRNCKNMTILEIGSGMSPIVIPTDNVIYSDVSLSALKIAKNTHDKGLFVVADSSSLPFKTNIFSHVICSEVLEHIDNDLRALQEIARVIKHSGSFLITFPHRHSYYACDDRFVGHFRRYELSEMEELLSKAGLKPVLTKKVLGPLEKITMIVTISFIRFFSLFTIKKTKIESGLLYMGLIVGIFRLFNILYAFVARVDAYITPIKLSSVLLIKATKQ